MTDPTAPGYQGPINPPTTTQPNNALPTVADEMGQLEAVLDEAYNDLMALREQLHAVLTGEQDNPNVAGQSPMPPSSCSLSSHIRQMRHGATSIRSVIREIQDRLAL